MVVSADDKGKVKIWDIRNYKCVQTLDFRDKTNVTKIVDMLQLGKICLLGSRITFVEFEDKMEIQKKLQTKKKSIPMWV
jgi:WD40 repeat protein